MARSPHQIEAGERHYATNASCPGKRGTAFSGREPGLWPAASISIDTGYYFHNTGKVEIKKASQSLAALAHETRLAIFRLLVQAGPEGINAGLICEELEIPAATLSFHLAHLSRTGLICGRPEGRFIFYVADYAAMAELLAYLTANCCQGARCPPKAAAGAAPLKRRRTATVRQTRRSPA